MQTRSPREPGPATMTEGAIARRQLLATMAAILTGMPAALQAQTGAASRWVVANPAGGPLDIVARAISDQLQARWGQPVIIDNRPGANGIIAADLVAKSRPDGHTLLVTATFSESIMPYAASKLPYDAERDLLPVTEIARVPFVLLVAADGPIRSYGDFLNHVQRSSTPVAVGGLGRGSSPHMAWELIRKGSGIKDVEYVGYPGPAPAQSDLIGGRLLMTIDTYGSSRTFLESGRLRAIAVTSAIRSAQLAAVPTLDESGLKGFEIYPWIGLVAPAATPPERLRTIQQAVADTLKQGPVRARLEQFGFDPVGNAPSDMAATIRRERQRFAPLVKELGISF